MHTPEPRIMTARQRELFDAILTTFLREGFATFTIDGATKRFRCSKSTLYALGATRDEVIRRILVSFFREVARSTDAAAAGRAAFDLQTGMRGFEIMEDAVDGECLPMHGRAAGARRHRLGHVFVVVPLDVVDAEFGDQYVTIDLTAPDQDDVSSDALDVAAAMIRSLESIDLTAREAMISELSDRTSEVTEFLLQQQDELGESLHEVLIEMSGDIHIDMIRSLRLMSVTILADEHGGKDPFCVLEYALDPDAMDDVLFVNLASDGSILSVTSAE